MSEKVTPLFDEFDASTAELCAGFDKPCTNERRSAYRKSLGQLGPIAWARVVEHAISESGPEKLPTTRECWQLHRKLKQRAAAPMSPLPDEWQGTDSLRIVNLMFFLWLADEITSGRRQSFTDRFTQHIIGKPRSIPNAELHERRLACLQLAAAEELMRAEGQSDLAHLQRSFDAAMARIEVLPPDHISNDAPYVLPRLLPALELT